MKNTKPKDPNKEYDEHGYVVRRNKTAEKRDIAEIADMINTFIDMSDADLAQFPLTEKTLIAIRDARKLSKSALRRQRLYINKLLRQSDVDSLQETLTQWQQRHELRNQHFHQLEQWRDQLISGNDNLAEQLLSEYPSIERGELFKLIHAAKREQGTDKPITGARRLFRYLRECV